MNLLSLFSGIGAFEKALDRLKIEYDLVNFCEFDKYAVKSYCAIHGVDESKNLGDITNVDEKDLPKDIDVLTYGFPCQDISISGKMRGLFNEDGSTTRSGLFFDALRIIEETKPKVAIAENVKNLTSKKFSEQFNIVLDSLENAGYNNYWKVLNAKDYGIPQNRERVFIVSIRKDVDTGLFKFPEGFPLESRLKDMLDDEVDEKFYLSDKLLDYICSTGTKNFYYKPEIDLDVARPLTSTMHKMHRASTDNYISDEYIKNGDKTEIIDGKPKLDNTDRCIQAADLNHYKNEQMNIIYSSEGISPSILTKTGGGRETKICVREATKKGYAEAYEVDSINLEHPNSKTRRGRVGKQVAQTLTTSTQQAVAVAAAMRGRYAEDGTIHQNIEISENEYSNSLTTAQKDSMISDSLRIRKLTPKECFRLMDFDDEDYEKAAEVNSNTQLYKQAGNSIVVACPYYIFKALIEANIFLNEKLILNEDSEINIIKKEKKEMELKIFNPTEDGFIKNIQWNNEEIKAEVAEKVKMYTDLVYTDDQIKEAKADRAKLNKFAQALDAKRKEIKKQCMQPYEDFENQVKEIIAIIDEPIGIIDAQIKGYEEKKKQDKLDAIKEYFQSLQKIEGFEEFKLSMIYDPKWLNATVSMKKVQDEINSAIEQITQNMQMLSGLPEFGFEALQVYKSSLDVNKAIQEAQRMSQIAKQKAEHEAEQERLKAEEEARKEAEAKVASDAEFEKAMNPPVEEVQEAAPVEEAVASNAETVTQEVPAKEWINFTAYMTYDDALALKEFFDSRNIEFKPL